ncbi:polymorphic toxin-type HINT domain-containing protein [Streptomyces sp. NPDC001443]
MAAGEAIGAVGGLAGGADCMAMGCGGGEPIAGEDADSPPSAGGSGGSGDAPKGSADAAPHAAGSGSGDAAAASGAGKESSTDSAGSNAAAPKKADAQGEATASSKSAAAPDEPSTGSSGTTNKGSGGGSRCSFSPSTPVLMAGGKTKAIGKIKTGDQVESADPKAGKHKGARTVQRIWINHDKDLLDVTVRAEGGHTATLHTTANHPFWDVTSHSWKPAGEPRRGDALNTADDAHVYVVRTRVTPGTADRWNLTVRDLHTYYVVAGKTPVLVHNTNCGDGATKPTYVWRPGRHPEIDDGDQGPLGEDQIVRSGEGIEPGTYIFVQKLDGSVRAMNESLYEEGAFAPESDWPGHTTLADHEPVLFAGGFTVGRREGCWRWPTVQATTNPAVTLLRTTKGITRRSETLPRWRCRASG